MTRGQTVLVKVTPHREKDEKGRKLGHNAYVKERTDAEIAKFGGKRYAAWAIRTRDGVETGCAERFDVYDFDGEAMSHAIYAAGCVREPRR